MKLRFGVLLLCVISFCVLSSCTVEEDDSSLDSHRTDTGINAEEIPLETMVSARIAGSCVDLSGFTDLPEEGAAVTVEHRYVFYALSGIPETVSLSASDAYIGEDGNIYVKSTYEDGASENGTSVDCFSRFDTEGKYLAYLPYQYTADAGERVWTVRMDAEDNIWYVTTPFEAWGAPADAVGDIICADSSGSILAHAEMSCEGNPLLLPDGRVAVMTANGSIGIFDASLQLLCEIPVNANALLLSPRGELVVQSGWLGQYSRIDLETYLSAPETEYSVSGLASGAALHFSAAESAYECYFSDRTGFWGYNRGDNAATLLCDWMESGQSAQYITVCGVLDENRIFVQINNPFSDGDQFGILVRDTDASQKPLRKITVGLLGLDGTDASRLTEAAARFNASNGTYYVELKSYGDWLQNSDAVMKAFANAMLTDSAEDIIVSSSAMREQLLDYSSKQAFVDLTQAIGTTLLPCAESAYRTDNGTIDTLPLNMQLSVLAFKDYILDGETPLTLTEMYHLLEMSETEGIALFNSIYPDRLLAIAAPSFADFAAGTCAYDSDAFAQFIQFYEAANGYRMDDGAGLRFDGLEYYIDDLMLEQDLADDAFLALSVPLSSIHAYPSLKLLYGKWDFSLHGYPANGREIVYFQSNADLRINADSRVQRGAMTFLAYLLSDEIQTYDTLTALPVTCSAMEVLLQTDNYYYISDSFDAISADSYFFTSLAVMNLDEETRMTFYPNAVTVTLTDADKTALRRLFYETEMQSLVDTTMSAIIEEELSAYRAGVRTLSETQRILQSRLYIYVNE